MRYGFIILTVMLCIVTKGYAQHSVVSTQIAVGAEDVLDTYLSPEKYKGVEFRFVSDVVRHGSKHPTTYQLTHEGALGYSHNRVKNAHALTGHYDFAFAMMHDWSFLDDKLRLHAGGMADLNLGFNYNTRNSANNPAQGYASLQIGPNVLAQYEITLFRKKMFVGYQARLPIAGVMFSPNYGQSYYELFSEGNYDSNVVFHAFKTFQIRQQLSLDIPVAKRTAIRVAYINDIRQGKPNNLKQHHYYNAGSIGVVINK